MIARLVLAVIVGISASGTTNAQTDADRSADSIMRERDDLFEYVDSLAGGMSSVPKLGSSTLGPDFLASYDRRDVLGLHDRPFYITYDRADGLVIRAGSAIPIAVLVNDARLRAHASIGYAFGSHYWQVSGGLSRDLFDSAAPTRVGIEGHIVTDTRDAWKMDALENTLFAAIAGGDARDYFKRRGFSVRVEQYLTPRVSAAVAYQRDDFSSARREAHWSLFGPAQPFRDVGAIREGVIGSIAITFIADYLSLRPRDAPAFSIALHAETGSGDASQTIAAFQSYVADARLKASVIGDAVGVAVRVRAGASTGSAPSQRLYSIGGVGTIAGYPQNEYVGNHMYLLQADVLVRPVRSGALRHIRLIISNEAASVTTARDMSNTLTAPLPSIADWNYSPGIALGTLDGRLRAGVAWRTDIDASPTVVVRLAHVF